MDKNGRIMKIWIKIKIDEEGKKEEKKTITGTKLTRLTTTTAAATATTLRTCEKRQPTKSAALRMKLM